MTLILNQTTCRICGAEGLLVGALGDYQARRCARSGRLWRTFITAAAAA